MGMAMGDAATSRTKASRAAAPLLSAAGNFLIEGVPRRGEFF